jgi:exodeoxyribonuclease III
MRIATFNINGLRARLNFLLYWLRDRQPDVIGLQELKCEDETFPFAELEGAGYRAVTHGQRAWNGVAILSRETATVRQKGLPGEEEVGARLISATIGGLEFVTIYCPNGKEVGHADYVRKLKWLDTLARYLNNHSVSNPVVVCGDFNICPTPLDSWNEERLKGTIFHTAEERARFQEFLKWGLCDLYRHAFPMTSAFSWWDYRAGAFHKNQGLRIDFLLGTESVRNRLARIEIDREYRKKKEDQTPSDHAPVIAELA